MHLSLLSQCLLLASVMLTQMTQRRKPGALEESRSGAPRFDGGGK